MQTKHTKIHFLEGWRVTQGGKWPPTWVIFFSKGYDVDTLHVILLETIQLLLMGQGARSKPGWLLEMRSSGMPSKRTVAKGGLTKAPLRHQK